MIQVSNVNSQFNIVSGTHNEYYKYETFKSISWGYHSTDDKYYVIINFIANDKNNSLRIYLPEVSNQGGWLNTEAGAIQAVNDISSWMSLSSAGISSTSKLPLIIRSSGDTHTYIPSNLKSVSFASTGSADAIISVNGNAVNLKVGETVSYDASDDYMSAYLFGYDTATNAGAELLIIMVLN